MGTLRSKWITLRLVFFISFSPIFVASRDLICDVDQHFCQNTFKCISKNYLCDGDNDCDDFSDEGLELCKDILGTTTACEPGQFTCFEKCITDSWVCDGDPDCDNGEDEDIRRCLHRTRPISVTTRATTTKAPCVPHQFDCGEKCIRMGWVCDGDQDCDDGGDEAEGICSTTPPSTVEFFTSSTTLPPSTEFRTPCISDQFDCGDRCISNNLVCNGRYDCSNKNDEALALCLPTTLRTEDYYVTEGKAEVPLPPEGYYESRSRDPPEPEDYYESRMRTGSVQTSAETTAPSTVKEVTHGHRTTSNDRTANRKTTNAYQTKIQLTTTTPKSSDPPEEVASLFIWLNWMECLLVLGLVIVTIAITFICIKRRTRKHSANLESRTGENRMPTVSYSNSASVPNCQLVLVSNAVRLEPALLQSTTSETHLGQPPPYNTLPAPNNQQAQNFTKGHECLV